MRIPAEVVPPATNVSKEPDDVRKAEPVTSAATIANDLSAGPQNQPLPAAKQRRPRQPLAAAGAEAQLDDQRPLVERRQKERRLEKRPVLLDTRSRSGRRKAGGDVNINIKV